MCTCTKKDNHLKSFKDQKSLKDQLRELRVLRRLAILPQSVSSICIISLVLFLDHTLQQHVGVMRINSNAKHNT